MNYELGILSTLNSAAQPHRVDALPLKSIDKNVIMLYNKATGEPFKRLAVSFYVFIISYNNRPMAVGRLFFAIYRENDNRY